MTTASHKPIALTVGEPAGIGPDLVLQLAQLGGLSNTVIIGDTRLLTQRAARLGLTLSDELVIRNVTVDDPDVCGEPSTANVDGVICMLDVAIDGCLDGEFAAMVTGPLHKGVINDAGVPFSGHTEYLAERTGAAMPVMLLASSELRVALITTHLPLREVSDAISGERIKQICQIIDHDLRSKFGLQSPRLLVCGLNPHAGEGGHLGREEIEIIEPALAELRDVGLDVVGPLPADTLFTEKYLRNADVAVAMYHDQGLPVLKYQGFGQAANITLGLPIIRTSVDHGTAFDIAGTGRADIGSLKVALQQARLMSVSQAKSDQEASHG